MQAAGKSVGERKWVSAPTDARAEMAVCLYVWRAVIVCGQMIGEKPWEICISSKDVAGRADLRAPSKPHRNPSSYAICNDKLKSAAFRPLCFVNVYIIDMGWVRE